MALLQDPDVKVQIRPDRRVAHVSVKRVLSVAREVGLHDVVFTAYTADK